MEASFLQRNPVLKDVLGVIVFVIAVIVGTVLINTFVFRSFNVSGPSMEPTLYTGDRLIVNRLPVSWSTLQNKPYTPKRGQVIVFKNPRFDAGTGDEYIVKRVIAFSGERVLVSDGKITVFNQQHPEGFNPDDDFNGEPGQPTSGQANVVVPDGSLFVAGDHRQGDFSFDSRNGLGTVPLYDVVGPVALRIYPFPEIRTF